MGYAPSPPFAIIDDVAVIKVPKGLLVLGRNGLQLLVGNVGLFMGVTVDFAMDVLKDLQASFQMVLFQGFCVVPRPVCPYHVLNMRDEFFVPGDVSGGCFVHISPFTYHEASFGIWIFLGSIKRLTPKNRTFLFFLKFFPNPLLPS